MQTLALQHADIAAVVTNHINRKAKITFVIEDVDEELMAQLAQLGLDAENVPVQVEIVPLQGML